MAKETIGYRVNADSAPIGVLNKMRKGLVAIYSERRNAQSYLGYYGGDAYPMSSEIQDPESNLVYGIVIANDGLGNGGFTHKSLNDFVNGDSDTTDEAKLGKFLRTLYGDGLFDNTEKDALDYALRSFSKVPTDGCFAADATRWGMEENQQTVLPFYKRDSQSLASRIVSVGIYYKFRRFAQDKKLKHWDEDSVSELRSQIELYLRGEPGEDESDDSKRGELWKNVFKIFSYNDASQPAERQSYFLPCTLACWFYIYDRTTHKVSAVAFNVGDCRCYLADTKQGMQQISTDDAQADGAMTNLIHFGTKNLTINNVPYSKLHARIIEADAPCALIACSDGIYDTCTGLGPVNLTRGKYGMPYGVPEANDFMFEYNFLQAMRRCYSFDDFVRETVFNFFGQSCAQGCAECVEGPETHPCKTDDSGTLGARFFGEKSPLELFERLRATKSTLLDKLHDRMLQLHEEGTDVPYTEQHIVSSEQQNDEKLEAYVRDNDGFNQLVNSLKNRYTAAYTSMAAAVQNGEKSELWGFEHTAQVTGFRLAGLFNPVSRRLAIFHVAVSDWNLCTDGIPQTWQAEPHKHVIFTEDELALLRKNEFGKMSAELTAKTVNYQAERTLALYKWFENSFYGRTDKGPYDILTETDKQRVYDETALQEAMNIGAQSDNDTQNSTNEDAGDGSDGGNE